MGRPKTIYDWEAKREKFYDLYINQNKSLDEVILLYGNEGPLPSKRQFQKQFREWKFPSKHVPVPNDPALVNRTRELWEVNASHKHMVSVLNNEGFEITERQLTKLRKQHQLWMRESRKSKNKTFDENGTNEDEGGLVQGESNGTATTTGQKRLRGSQDIEAEVPTEVIAKRQERQAKLMAESEERLKSRTRRRRTRYWAGLPPDEGLGPRFPSELTLAESIVELSLDKAQYRSIRQSFEQICQTCNILKKTICGPEKWTQAKNDLISRFPQLQMIFWDPSTGFIGQSRKPMALDVICMDVTKRLRTSGLHISIADAKNTLGLTPEEGREVRAAFDNILRSDFFTGKLDTTKEHWEELKSRWIKESTRLRLALSLGQADPAYASKVRAIESIARDVQKRNRDRQTKQAFPRDSMTKLQVLNSKASNGTSKSKTPRVTKPAAKSKNKIRLKESKGQQSTLEGEELLQSLIQTTENRPPMTPISGTDPMSTLASQALAQGAPSQSPVRDFNDMQIDPSLLEAACLPSHHPQATDYSNDHDIFTHLQQANSILTPRAPKPVYLRLSPASSQRFPLAPKLWLDTLPADMHSVETLRAMAVHKLDSESIGSVQRIEGLASGEEAERWEIGEDDELEAYLLHVGASKATFILELA